MKNVNNITVVGCLGLSGISTLKYLATKYPNKNIRAMDTREVSPYINDVPKNMPLHTGSLNQEWLIESDLIIISQGLDPRREEFQKARDAGVEFIGDIELFARELLKKENYPKVIAITGSNGKSTVVTLCNEMLKANGKKVALCGNIGVSPLDMIDGNYDYYVLELSSYQLETLESLKYASSAHLNLSQDHLDRYDSIDGYNDAKHNIFKNCELAVFNADDSETKPRDNKNTISFGVNKGDYHLQDEDGITKLIHHGKVLLSEDEINLVGQHNLLNVLATFALLEPFELDASKTSQAIKNFTGLSHRCELIFENNGVKWINDSKATNVGSVVACLNGLKVKNKLHLLMGGLGKGAEFSELSSLFKNFDLQLYCYGEDKTMLAELDDKSITIETMEEALQQISPTVTEGDIVLLSPACASFDQFKSFEHRGEVFAELAKELGK
ncbi:MAG: UDP-N-acetylmuramoyl-L-alanine--D-glutamate ligase [Proteobacteria bacterium]|nr:UDP-N-acetylmuramoyl-L-alanine--D-glutamate ligase [Pseudomonadota bacterium]